MLTAIDQVANQNHLQMIKAAIPYLDIRRQKKGTGISKRSDVPVYLYLQRIPRPF